MQQQQQQRQQQQIVIKNQIKSFTNFWWAKCVAAGHNLPLQWPNYHIHCFTAASTAYMYLLSDFIVVVVSIIKETHIWCCTTAVIRHASHYVVRSLFLKTHRVNIGKHTRSFKSLLQITKYMICIYDKKYNNNLQCVIAAKSTTRNLICIRIVCSLSFIETKDEEKIK